MLPTDWLKNISGQKLSGCPGVDTPYYIVRACYKYWCILGQILRNMSVKVGKFSSKLACTSSMEFLSSLAQRQTLIKYPPRGSIMFMPSTNALEHLKIYII